MKRYIIETDDKSIWSYEAEREGENFEVRLLRKQGEKAEFLKNSQEYWEWFVEEAALPDGAEVDICFVYPKTNEKEFCEFFKKAPKFVYSVQSSWNTAALVQFFTHWRDTALDDVVRKGLPNHFVIKVGESAIVNEIDLLKLGNDLKKAGEKGKNLPDESNNEQSEPRPHAKSRVKVYAPSMKQTLNTEDKAKSDTADVVEKEVIIKKDMGALSDVKKENSVHKEKITPEEWQRYLQNETKGQVDTVKP